jgi:hypothetical protein
MVMSPSIFQSPPLPLPSLMIGGAVFSHHYNEDLDQVPTEAILSQAIEAGANSECYQPVSRNHTDIQF